MLNARAGALTRSAVFLADLPPGRLLQLAELCLVLSVAPGTLLAKQAAPLESMVVVQVRGGRGAGGREDGRVGEWPCHVPETPNDLVQSATQTGRGAG